MDFYDVVLANFNIVRVVFFFDSVLRFLASRYFAFQASVLIVEFTKAIP